MFWFGGLFTKDIVLKENMNPDYIYNNFNDFLSGFVTLFEILIQNNWP